MNNATQLNHGTKDTLNFNLEHITKILVYYSFLIVSNLSFISNLLNILICNRRKLLKKNTFGLYNTLMSSFNILSLIFSYLIYFPYSIDEQDLLLKSTLNCVLISYLNQVCLQMCSWLNVTMSIDRTISIGFSHKFSFHKSKRNINIICACLCLIICLANVEIFFGAITSKTIIDRDENRTLSFQYCISLSQVGPISDVISQTMRTVLPVILEFLLNAILIYKLWRSRRRSANVNRSLNRDYKFAFLIVILNFLFLITQTPFMVVTIYACVINYISQTHDSIFISDYELIVTKYMSIITGVFSTYMFGSIFFVNLFFNRIFQMELCNGFDEIMIRVHLFKEWSVIRLKESMMKSINFKSIVIKTRASKSQPICVSFKRTSEF